jgi:hypothetical protein
MDHHARTVDVGDFEVESFLEPQATRVDGGEEGPVVEGMDATEEPGDFLPAQDGRQAVFFLGAQDAEDEPAAGQDLLIEEADAAVANAHGFGRPTRDIVPMEEVVPELVLVQEVGGLAVELGKHAHGAGVGLLGALGLAVELQGVDHGPIPVFHHVSSPLLEWLMSEWLHTSPALRESSPDGKAVSLDQSRNAGRPRSAAQRLT